MTELLSLLPDEIEVLLADLGPSGSRRSQPAYRARQLFSWLHRGASFEEMSDLPAALRARLSQQATAGSLRLRERLTARDQASKFAFHTADAHLIETVLIPHPNRNTVCVSSQIGCRYRCHFCATGKQGLTRDLTAGEIVEQVVRVQQAIIPQRTGNVVFMGMGEPLENYEAVLRAVRLLNHPWGLHIAARHIAISTCGLPDQIRRLAGEGLQVALAISLHAASDELRSRLVPVNRKHPLAELMPHNPPEADKPDPGPALAFAQRLRRLGLEVAVRRSRGAEVLGACGQLRERATGPNNIGRASARPMR
jgi:23S rRNA (adenine2503-C2)-methyltransferase